MMTVTQILQTLLIFIDRLVVPLIFAIAFVMFIWGVYRFFVAGGAEDEKRKEGRKLVLYAVIGFVLMLSIWGIVRLFTNTFGFNTQARPDLPFFNQSGGLNGGNGGGNIFFGGGSSGQGTQCRLPSQCPLGFTCQGGRCTSTGTTGSPCQTDVNCKDGRVCSPNKICVPGQQQSQDLNPGPGEAGPEI